MSFNQQILMLAGAATAAAIFVPAIFGSSSPSAKREPANITRADDSEPFVKPSLLGSRKKKKPVQKVRRSSQSCKQHNDLKIPNCNSGPRRKAMRSGEVRKSKGGRSVMVQQDAQGHFRLNARMNGRRIPVLVDTGATSVAINQRTARRLGIQLTSDDFKHEANTANGKTKYALATIREVRIGGIVVDNVQAAVLSDRALDSTLLGMSFLKKLSKFSVENGELRLTQ